VPAALQIRIRIPHSGACTTVTSTVFSTDSLENPQREGYRYLEMPTASRYPSLVPLPPAVSDVNTKKKEGGGVMSGPGAARTILLFHIISARSSKQPPMARTFLKVNGAWLLFFVSARTNKRHHHHQGLRKLAETPAIRTNRR
jgi:hypothetical protein